MKNFLRVSLLVLAGFCSTGLLANIGMTRAPASGSNPISLDVNLSTVFGFREAGLNVGITPDISFGVRGSQYSFDLPKDDSLLIEDSSISKIGFEANVKWYKNGLVNDGLYIKPFIGRHMYTVSFDELEVGLSTNNVGGLLGYQWVWDSGFKINWGAGMERVTLSDVVTLSSNKDPREKEEFRGLPSKSGIDLSVELSFGFII